MGDCLGRWDAWLLVARSAHRSGAMCGAGGPDTVLEFLIRYVSVFALPEHPNHSPRCRLDSLWRTNAQWYSTQ
eukprot:6535129-Prymnesium_polylepis.1